MASIGQIGNAPAAQGPLRWFIWACKWWWSKRSLIWGTILLNILLGALVTWLFTDPSSLTKLPIGGIVRNPYPYLIGFIVLLSLTIISGVGNLVQATPSRRKLLRRYLGAVIGNTELLTLRGIPAGLIAESVRLDQVFIPLQLRPNRPRTDYPLSDSELERYRHYLAKSAASADSGLSNLERIIVDAERNWQFVLKKSDRISIADMWQQLTREQPAAVIQGYPGMGKSTLMERLSLHMSRVLLRKADPEMQNASHFKPALLPILIRLGKYDGERKKQDTLTLDDYLPLALADLGVADSLDVVRSRLDSGRCLVIFDGLDEVSELERRQQVQEAIKIFIRNHRNIAASAPSFNRFLITSRVAGYDQAAFPDYRHFTVAELTDEQIDYFLPRWCRANASRTRESAPANGSLRDPFLEQETRRRLAELETAIKGSQGVHDLAENPLLLTLLAVMQQNSIALPRQRVELYKTVTLTLLENRNIAKDLIPIPENQAIQYLGPLAFTMQETDNSFAREREVLASLQKTIGSNGASPEQAATEAKEFLSRIRERGGLFVQRTGDYFGFMHRTFQEYFAARYILNQIKTDPDHWIAALVQRARQSDDLWREPFLLAVAYQSNENEKTADKVIKLLLDIPQNASQEQHEHDLLLAAECVIEAKPLSIDNALERNIAARLLQTYEQAQGEYRFESCELIENMIPRWLLGLPKEIHRLSLLTVLREAITDIANMPLQRATLTMLTMIAQNLADCPPNVFAALVPPLLSLAGLPSVGNYRPALGIAASANLDVADLALTVLSFLGKPGPSGLLLADVRQYFKDHPNHLRLLARYSLESGALITPCVVPLSDENYRRYEAAIDQWLKLDETSGFARLSEQAIDSCLRIHQSLLDCAEEVMYPTATLLLMLLAQSAAQPEQPWQGVWKDYLERQLTPNSYINYQQSALLWATLFIDMTDQQHLSHLLINNYNSKYILPYRYALRFFSNSTEDIRGIRYLRSLENIGNLKYLRQPTHLKHLRDIRDIRYLSDTRSTRNTRERKETEELRDIRDTRDTRYLTNIKYLRYLTNIKYLRYLINLIFTQEISEKAIHGLASTIDRSEQADLLSVLLGRVLQIVEANEKGKSVESEVQQIVQCISPTYTAASDPLVSEAALDILRYLPARSVNEIQYVLNLAEQTTNQQIWQACALALRYARPETEEAWQMLEVGKRSQKKAVREAVEERIRRQRE